MNPGKQKLVRKQFILNTKFNPSIFTRVADALLRRLETLWSLTSHT